ncbi:hypothetical protein SOHN41_00502 [Shewanella sp. HN-41]|nr:hypothetical protein SOHN41_00502 [Shewanella sp. HN-41]
MLLIRLLNKSGISPQQHQQKYNTVILWFIDHGQLTEF